MLRITRKDWFPIVATDLFCGLLAAVIIFDAVSPREVSTAGQDILVEFSYPNAIGPNSAAACEDDKSRLIFSFVSESTRRSTAADANLKADQEGGLCRVQAAFSDVHFDRELEDPLMLITESRVDLSNNKIVVTVSGLSDITCSRSSTECPLK
jgi:hypothetical protein